jgi:RNA polymerase sigma-70 factor (sigma-E family)
MQRGGAVNADAEARYREFVAAELHPLLRTAYLLCGSWHTAEDLVQTTFVSLYRAWSRMPSWDDPRAYARRTLTNAFLSSRRRRSAQEQLFAEVPRSTRAGSTPAADDCATVDERERQRELLRVLPPRQRAVLVLRFWEDYSVADTAELLGISAGTVKSQTSDALGTLRRSLAAEQPKEPSHD